MDVQELKEEIEALKAALKAREVKAEETGKVQAARPVYVAPGRRLEVFAGRPTRQSDQGVHDWVAGVRAQLELRGIKGKEAAAFIREYLEGDARREVSGRGEDIKDDPESIFSVLTKVFGDGNSLPRLQQSFYSFEQGPSFDLLSCSLQLVDLFDRMVQLDPTLKVQREPSLKSRFAEAVRDEALRRELRRLNIESPQLSFFELRDRALEWLGPVQTKRKDASVRTMVADPEVMELLKKQAEQMEQQQKQLDKINAILSRRQPRKTPPGDGKCFNCGEKGHFQKDCRKPKKENPDLNG
ncbi:uncharacterized protein LOC129271552 [Lytechinus pictus]|uniref:uncharacterized protein LOC129271552 n=1 Tax=Lytechinus pictus TaxID=7653 RepID=UPI0030B9F560